jgi:hypothetical protein
MEPEHVRAVVATGRIQWWRAVVTAPRSRPAVTSPGCERAGSPGASSLGEAPVHWVGAPVRLRCRGGMRQPCGGVASIAVLPRDSQSSASP